ncbi:MAG: hypothetical protein ABI051_17690 [Vicinamibacterales bacterium]
MLIALLELLLLTYLPGALMLRLPGASKPYRAGLPAEERVFWAVLLSVLWSLMLVVGLALLGRYTLVHALTANLLMVALLLASVRSRLGFGGLAPRVSWTALLPVALVVLGCALYFPSSEYVIGGRDPGTYINEGVQIAQRGAIVIADPVVASVPSAFRDLFFPSHDNPHYYSLRFMGFYVQDPDRGLVIGQFQHLYPASIAVAYDVAGLTGARNVVGIWTIGGLVAVYFALRRVIGSRGAALAAGLLALNVISIWFGRYPNSEVVLQALLFSALLAFSHARQSGGQFFGVLSGALLGCLLFLRFEVVLAFLSVGVTAMMLPAIRQRVGVGFGAALAVTGSAGYWYLQGPLRAYAYYPLDFTRAHGPLVLGVIAAGACLARWLLRRETFRSLVVRITPVSLTVTLVALAVYAYFFRQAVGSLALGDAIAFRSFGWYLGDTVLACAIAGGALLVLRRFWAAPELFLTFTAFSVFFFYKTRIVPEHFWTARRFLGVTLPCMILFVVALAEWLVETPLAAGILARITDGAAPRLRRQLRTSVPHAIVLGLMAPVGLAFWHASRPVWHHVEYAGLIPKLEALSARFGDRDLVLVESRNAGTGTSLSDVHVLATPLAYIYGRNVLMLNSPAPQRDLMDGFLEWAQSRYSGIYFLGGGGTDLLTSNVGAVPIASDRIEVPEYDVQVSTLPTGVRRKDIEFGLYRLVPVRGAPSGPVDLQIGLLDDLNVVRFHARERTGAGLAFRWTGGQSFVILPPRSVNPAQLTIWMSTGGRPAAAPAAVVAVAFDDADLGTAVPVDELRPYVFHLPASLAGALRTSPARIRLRVSTWNPKETLGIEDDRNLGVQVARVETR